MLPVLLAAGLMASSLTWNWDSVVYDWTQRLKHRQPDSEIVIVAIDQASLDETGKWPWSRTLHADLIRKLDEAGAAVIGYDVIFAEGSNPRVDGDLASAIAESGRVVLPVVNEQIRSGGQLRELLPFPGAAKGAAALGHVDRPIDRDAVTRSVYLKAGLGEPRWDSFALAILRLISAAPSPLPGATRNSAGGEGGAMKWQRDHRLWISYVGPPGRFPRISFSDLLTGRFPASDLEGKIVLVGATAVGLGDVLSTPVSGNHNPMPGVEVIANEIDTLKRHLGITPLPAPLGLTLCGLLVLLFTQLLPRLPERHSIVLVVSGVAITLAITVAGVTLAGRWFPPVATIVGMISGYVLWSWRRLILANRHLSHALVRLDSTVSVIEPRPTDNASERNEFLARLMPEERVELPAHAASSSETATEPAAMMSGSRTTAEERPKRLSATTVERMERRIQLVEAATEKLRGMSEFIDQSLSQMTSGVIVTDTAGQVVLINPAARSLFEESDERAGHSQSLLHYWGKLRFTPRSTAMTCLRQALVEGKQVTIEAGGPRDRDLLLKLVPFKRDGDITGLLVDITNITAVRIDENRRRETLSFLSHDLRSPLASIISAAQLAKMDPEHFSSEAFASRLETNARKTLALADDFLDLLRVGGVRAEDFRPLELCAVIQQAMATVSDLASQKKIAVSAECVAPQTVHGDAGLLERLFANLLSNAIKYSPGGATVTVSAHSEGRNVHCEVRDTGYGIAPENLPILFARYERIKRNEHVAEQGVGIGLVFVKSVVEQHLGSISVDSEVDVGTRFHITLPADAS